MQAFLLILLLIIALLLCLSIHEFGHFFFAYFFKVNVREFSIGIGPRLFSFRRKSGMRISLRLLPVAAYVSMDSQEVRAAYADEKPSKKKDEILAALPPNKLMLEQLKFWQRQTVNMGGILFNVVSFCIFLLIARFTLEVQTDYGVFLRRWFVDLGYMLSFQSGQGASLVGAANSLSQIPDQQLNYGYVFFSFITLLSLTMGIFNFLPMPPLDGFKLLTATLWKVRGKEPSAKTKDAILWVSLVLAVYLVAAVVTSDIRSFTG